MVQNLGGKLIFNNDVINKKKLQRLMSLTFHNYGIIRSSLIADNVKNLTFHYATMSGISLSIEDLRVPFRKRSLIGLTTNEVEITEQNFNSGNITAVERFQKVIDIWNNANNTLKDDVLTYFRESDPLNPLYIMAFSGARGNISQVRQLVGMRGLMADPQGQIIDLPIKSNFREGLKVTEYIISSYGARKGLVDTALRTADSGYLTRRLVDVAQDIIVRDDDCLTKEGLSLSDLLNRYKVDLSIEDRLIGRLLVKPVNLIQDNIILPADTEIDKEIVTKIKDLDYDTVGVRSPLTCNAIRSVCRKCYGWHLSYSKIIDLGEAVGILAAQSIGEPGTQLTMRTFHTGGVFSGDLTNQIRAPFSGTLKYNLTSATSLVRTIHGEKAFNLKEAVTLSIENQHGNVCSLDLPSGAILFVNNNTCVYSNQVVAEIKKDANIILEEDRRDIYTQISGEVFLQDVDLEKVVDGEGAIKKISKTTGLVWILYGERYVLPSASNLNANIGHKFSVNETMANQTITNKYAGIVNFDNSTSQNEISIITSSMTIDNGIINCGDSFDTFNLTTPETKNSFNLMVKENDFLVHGQTIASLTDTSYKTETGGIIYYSTTNFLNKKKRNTKKIFNGTFYWLSEETHHLDSNYLENFSLLHGCFVQAGSELNPDITTKISGFAQIDEENSELIIKPGELYEVKGYKNNVVEDCNRFVKPGDILFSKIVVQKLSYLEFLQYQGISYVLLRPVKIFNVPQEKGFHLNYKFFPNVKSRSATLQTVKRFFYKDGERIKSSNNGVNLLQTFFILNLKDSYSDLQTQLTYIPIPLSDKTKEQQYLFKLTCFEPIKASEKLLKSSQLQEKLFLKPLVLHNQYVEPNTSIATVEMRTKFGGTLVATNKGNNIELLLVKNTDIKKCTYNPSEEELFVKKGDLVRIGTHLSTHTRSKYAGQIYKIMDHVILIRLGIPYLISEGTVLRVDKKSLVEKSDMLATLVYDKMKTVDIVQGLPKVEEILEARKIKNGCLLSPNEGHAFLKNLKIEIKKSSTEKFLIDVDPNTRVNFNNGQYVTFLEPLTDGPINPHDKLETLFNYYQSKYPVHEACKKSFKFLQLFLVSEVQKTYLSQGVQIADKHIEIIVKQMTSKVRVYYGGATTLLPGEILEINQAEAITKASLSSNEEPPLYRPLLLGITKASLNSDSFISAASFQETTRVLTDAAIEGKKDWLNGLKENVIIGRLIPAGTGFNCFENLKKVGAGTSTNLLITPKKMKNLKSYVLQARKD